MELHILHKADEKTLEKQKLFLMGRIVEKLYIRDRVREILGKEIRRLKIRPTSYAVDPGGRFFVLAYEIIPYYIEEGRRTW